MKFTPTEEKQIVTAIKRAEQLTTGEIRVHITERIVTDSFAEASAIFNQLNMQQTKHRNGVLIYISLRSKNFTILGDSGIHESAAENFWEDVKNEMLIYFSNKAIVTGICIGIAKVGQLLQQKFPASSQTSNTNELSNEISYDA